MSEQLASIRIDMGEDLVFTMFYRPGTKDRKTIEENWKTHPYRLSKHWSVVRRYFIDQEYARIVAAGGTPLIIDAGANIGASVLFFSWKYPKARIIAVEPEPENFRLLMRNTCHRENISYTNSALVSVDGVVRLYDPGRSTDSYRVTGSDDPVVGGDDMGRVPGMSVATLMRVSGAGCEPLLAKLDIEGGEADVFSANTDWVDAFPAIAIELHDWMLPGEGSSAAFLKCIGEKGRDFINPISTDIVFSLANPRVAATGSPLA